MRSRSGLVSVGRLLRGLSVVAALALGAQLPASPARAALGDDVSVVAADQVRLQAELKVMPGDHYTIHELALPSGVRLRNFVGDGGKVFAVSWSGGWRPNLRDVMGVHYDDFIAATRGKRITRGVARIALPGMVVVMGGHQRAFFGHVYLTALVPDGFLSKSELMGGSPD